MAIIAKNSAWLSDYSPLSRAEVLLTLRVDNGYKVGTSKQGCSHPSIIYIYYAKI